MITASAGNRIRRGANYFLFRSIAQDKLLNPVSIFRRLLVKFKNALISLYSKISSIFKTTSSVQVQSKASSSVIEAAVRQETSEKKIAVTQKLEEIHDNIKNSPVELAKLAKENAEFFAKLAVANAAADDSLERERQAAVALKIELQTSRSVVVGSDSAPFADLFSGEALAKGKIKSAGKSGVVSYIATELAFWSISFPIIIASYHSSTGDWLNIAVDEDKVKSL